MMGSRIGKVLRAKGFHRSAAIESLEQRQLFAAAGLVAAYAFDTGSGTVAADASGTGNNGTISGATWSASGKFGSALSFNGSSAIVNVADANSLDLTTGMTLEAWVRPTSLTGYRTAVMKDVPGELAYSLYASGDTNRPNTWARIGGTSRDATGTAALPLNAWSHLAATYNGTTLVLYVNGVQAASRAVVGSIQTSANPFHVGGNPVWGEYFAGLIDEVRVYNRALAVSEIQADMNAPVGAPAAPDTIAPNVSLTAPATGANVSGTLQVTASASDNVGVAGVQFKLDGVNLGAEDTFAPYAVAWNADSATLAGHTLTAVARDAAGNSTTSAAVGVTVVDSSLPTVAISAPAAGANVSGPVTVTATASDNRAVAGVQFLLDGVNLGAEDTAAPYSLVWNADGASPGAHALTAVARDAAGNYTTSASVGVTVVAPPPPDTTAPTVSVSGPADASSVSGTVQVTASAGDDVGVVGVQFKLDGANLGAEDTTAPYSVAWIADGATLGGHALTAVARDAAGNAAASAAVNVTVVDSTAPAVSLTAPVAGASVSASVTVTASASDNRAVAGVQFLLDGVALGAEDTAAPYSLTWDTTAAPNGPHTLSARARDAAGNLATSAGRAVTVSNAVTDPAAVGQWSSLINLPIVAINMVLLSSGKILMWDGGPDCIGATTGTLWDLATNTFKPVPSESQQHVRDIFCSAQTVLADGRVLVVGGHECDDPNFLGTAIASTFDPVAEKWTTLPNMSYRRWYPTATTLPDGRALVTAGSDVSTTSYIPIPEVYNPVTNTFSKLSGANQVIPNYPFVFDLPDGRVVVAGSDEAKMATYVLDVKAQSWSVVDPTILDAGSAVMYLPGKVMKAGSSYLSPPADNGGSVPSKNTTYVLDMTSGTPAWQQTAPMAFARTHLNLTLLPDGNVFANGGSSDIGGVNTASAVYPGEMWSPATKTWTTMASAAGHRMYHSTATLLPDGRVLTAGSGHNFFNSVAAFNAEIYSPPYLFKGSRPTITSSPDTLGYNSSFFVGTPDGASVASVSLIRNGSVTHAFNMDQRFVPLSFQQTAGGLTVQAPPDANTAPPGTYMLFIVNANGVPSVAPFVRLPAGYEDAVAPTAPGDPTAAGGVGNAALSWTAATDNVGVVKYNVHRSTTSGFTPSAANRVAQVNSLSYVDTGMASGTYYYRVTAEDAAGNVGPASGEASATVTGDVTPPSATLTSPASGATLTGTVTLAATASDDIGVAGVQFLLDGAPVGAEDTAAPYSTTWNSMLAANGTHTLAARARDAAGNTTTSPLATVNVSNVAAPVGLVAYYSFNEGVGTTFTDGSGTGNNGTVGGATWAAAGKYGAALQFNGSSVATVPDSNSLDLTTGMTMEAWVRPTALGNYRTIVMKDATAELCYTLYASGSTNRPSGWGRIVGTTGSSASVIGTAALPLNAWTHVATTYNGSALVLFVNGVQVASRALSGSLITSANPLHIGGNSVWGEYFTGAIDEVRVYNRALTALQIQADMNSAGQPVQTYSLSGTVTPAAGGAGATLTLSGTVNTSVLADASGNYLFAGIPNGTYTLSPSNNGYTFTPASQTVTINGGSVTGVNFTATAAPVSGIQLIQTAVNGNENGTASMTVTPASNIRAGSFLIVTGTAARPNNSLALSDSLGNTFALAGGPFIDPGQDVAMYIWYVPSAIGGRDTFTIRPGSTSALEIHVSEWSGIDTVNPVDQVVSTVGSGTAVSSGSRTTTADGELVFGYAWVVNNASAGSGYTALSLVNGDLDEYRIQTAAGPVATTFTQSSGGWLAAMVTFRPTPATSPAATQSLLAVTSTTARPTTGGTKPGSNDPPADGLLPAPSPRGKPTRRRAFTDLELLN